MVSGTNRPSALPDTPHEALHVDHVPWSLCFERFEEVRSEGERALVGPPVERRVVLQLEAAGVGGCSSDRGLEEQVPLGLEEEAEVELGREIGKIAPGEIVGEVAAFDSYLSRVTLVAQQNSLLLAIPRKQLLIKFQQDPAMAARFYRVVAIILSGRLQGIIGRLGFGKDSYQFGSSLSEDVQYEDEIDLAVMDNLTLGGARFDWMLKRLQVS